MNYESGDVMKKMLSILACKSSSFILEKMHRGGSLPGTIALKLDSNILKQISTEAKIIVVTGTNGKTSTANMIATMLETANYQVITNRRGDNMHAGITTSIVKEASLNGEVNVDYIVLEVDELNVPYIMRDLKVDTVVVTNFFRDQLDRSKEMELLINKVENSLKDFKGNLILNGNDPNVCRLAYAAKDAHAIYYGMDEAKNSSKESSEASEGKFCPICHHVLHYDYYQYSHIGKFSCSNDACDFASSDKAINGKVVDLNKRLFTYQNEKFKAPQAGFYTMYNCMAVITCALLYHISFKYVHESFTSFVIPSGRNETLMVNNQPCIINLIKNPTGANEVLKVIEQDDEVKDLLFVINDQVQDGTDISWLYDTNFERIISPLNKRIICSGTRCYEMALRLKYGGYKGDLVVIESLSEACNEFKALNNKKYALATYTALQPTRKNLIN